MILLRALGPWAPVIATLNTYFNRRDQEGDIESPVDVAALQDSDGQQLFSCLITQSLIVQGTTLAPAYPLTVTIIDGKRRRDHLRFPG